MPLHLVTIPFYLMIALNSLLRAKYHFARLMMELAVIQYRIHISYVFLAFSEYFYEGSPTWVQNVNPILTQYKRMAPIMDTILDMSSYTDVTKYHNIQLMKQSLQLPASDPVTKYHNIQLMKHSLQLPASDPERSFL